MFTVSKREKRRYYGEHFTPIEIFKSFILPEIKDYIYNYVWVDLFAGEGNLVLPILDLVPDNYKIDFFRKHIFLFDIQEDLVNKAIDNAVRNYGIPKEIAIKNIRQRDTILDYPTFLLDLSLPIFHITNPPYLYIGYIKKHSELEHYLKYFDGENKGYQDLYQLSLINDLRFGIKKMIYIIPTNFLFGFSISNKIREELFYYYNVRKAIFFEKKIFEHTGVNVMITFFERKNRPCHEKVIFEGIKINKNIHKKVYVLNPSNKYRGGDGFEEFVNRCVAIKHPKISFYLTSEEVEKNKGPYEVEVIDANSLKYDRKKIYVNKDLYDKIKSNILFVRTLDTGTNDGRAGLYEIKEVFKVDGILVTKAKYRTHPIQIFIEPSLNIGEQVLIKNYFNLLLEFFRKELDSEFMTTYKYANSEYTRKYLGLTQVKKLIQTFPFQILKTDKVKDLISLIKDKNGRELVNYIKILNRDRGGY